MWAPRYTYTTNSVGESNFVELLHRQISMIWAASSMTARNYSHEQNGIRLCKSTGLKSELTLTFEKETERWSVIPCYCRVTRWWCCACVRVCVCAHLHLSGGGRDGKEAEKRRSRHFEMLPDHSKRKAALHSHLHTQCAPCEFGSSCHTTMIPKVCTSDFITKYFIISD